MHYTLSWTRTKTSVHAENISLMCCWRKAAVSYKFQFVSCLSHDFLIHPLSGHLSPKGKSILSSALYKCSEKRTDILTAGKKKKLKKKKRLVHQDKRSLSADAATWGLSARALFSH